jgi:hypothetical protein
MTERATLLALAERCEQAAGPDRELDKDISRVLLPAAAEGITRSRYGWSYRVFGPSGWDDEWLETLPYTASLDAAVTLVPEWCGWMVMKNVAKVGRWPKRGATPALALCAAALQARAAAYE